MFAAWIGTDAAEQRCLGFPDALDGLVGAIGLNVIFDTIGGAAQLKLAQSHEVALAEEISRSPFDLLRHVDLARLEACQQLVGRNVEQAAIAGPAEKRTGDGFPHADAGDAANDVVQALQMLDVERRKHVDSDIQQLADVLTTVWHPLP